MRVYDSTYEELRRSGGDSLAPAGKVCQACCCSFVGVCLYLVSLAMVIVSESSHHCTDDALSSARATYQSIGCGGPGREDPPPEVPVYLSCPISEESRRSVTPRDFGAEWLEGAFNVREVVVEQHVSMLVCKEKATSREVEGRDGSKQTVDAWSYVREWSDSAVESHRFKAWGSEEARAALSEGCGREFRENPGFPMASENVWGHSLVAGGYDLSRHLHEVKADAPVSINPGIYHPPHWYGGGHIEPERRVARDGQSYSYGEFESFYGRPRGGQEWAIAQVAPEPERRVAADGASYTWDEFIAYYGADRGPAAWEKTRRVPGVSGGQATVLVNELYTCPPGAPMIGCLKVSYRQSSATHVSLISAFGPGAQTRPWRAPPSWMCGGNEVDMFFMGSIDPENLLDQEVLANSYAIWLQRVIWLFLAILGVKLFLGPIPAITEFASEVLDLFSAVPIIGRLPVFLGDAVVGAVGLSVMAISFGVGGSSVLAVLGLSWCAVRPKYGVPLLLLCALVFGFTVHKMVQYSRTGQAKRMKVA